MWRDITQINGPGRVSFSADTPAAEFWMRRQYGGRNIVFTLPGQQAEAVALKQAAEGANFRILALARQRPASP